MSVSFIITLCKGNPISLKTYITLSIINNKTNNLSIASRHRGYKNMTSQIFLEEKRNEFL